MSSLGYHLYVYKYIVVYIECINFRKPVMYSIKWSDFGVEKYNLIELYTILYVSLKLFKITQLFLKTLSSFIKLKKNLN